MISRNSIISRNAFKTQKLYFSLMPSKRIFCYLKVLKIPFLGIDLSFSFDENFEEVTSLRIFLRVLTSRRKKRKRKKRQLVNTSLPPTASPDTLGSLTQTHTGRRKVMTANIFRVSKKKLNLQNETTTSPISLISSSF